MPITISKKVAPKRKIEKCCSFPGCNTIFHGIGPTKYCDEHRLLKYRKSINKMLQEKKQRRQPKIENANQTIKHKNNTVQHIECECALEGCGQKFEVVVIPHTFVYPQYCLSHRNQYKRELFKKIGKKQ